MMSKFVWKSGIAPPVLNRFSLQRRVSVAGSTSLDRSTILMPFPKSYTVCMVTSCDYFMMILGSHILIWGMKVIRMSVTIIQR